MMYLSFILSYTLINNKKKWSLYGSKDAHTSYTDEENQYIDADMLMLHIIDCTDLFKCKSCFSVLKQFNIPDSGSIEKNKLSMLRQIILDLGDFINAEESDRTHQTSQSESINFENPQQCSSKDKRYPRIGPDCIFEEHETTLSNAQINALDESTALGPSLTPRTIIKDHHDTSPTAEAAIKSRGIHVRDQSKHDIDDTKAIKPNNVNPVTHGMNTRSRTLKFIKSEPSRKDTGTIKRASGVQKGRTSSDKKRKKRN